MQRLGHATPIGASRDTTDELCGGGGRPLDKRMRTIDQLTMRFLVFSTRRRLARATRRPPRLNATTTRRCRELPSAQRERKYLKFDLKLRADRRNANVQINTPYDNDQHDGGGGSQTAAASDFGLLPV